MARGKDIKEMQDYKVNGPASTCGAIPVTLKRRKKTWNKGESAFISRKRQKKFIIMPLLMADFGPASIFPGWMYQDQKGNINSLM